MRTPADLLAAYDDLLRTDAETPGALSVTALGPLWLVTFPGGRGFVTYRDLGGADAEAVRRLVAGAVERYRVDPDVERVEWKTRGHDHAPGLHEALVAHGFAPGEPESIMIGDAAGLAVDVALPEAVTLRRVTAEADVRAMSATADLAFGDPVSAARADAVLHRLALDDAVELWVAEAEGVIVATGRLEPVAGTAFAGIWGGATLPAWRGRGIYRALTAARARSALRGGRTLVHSDSTEHSRPILERSGLVKVSTTTPYTWRRGTRPPPAAQDRFMSATSLTYRWTQQAFVRATEAGVFDGRVELVDGQVWPVSIGRWHGRTVARCVVALTPEGVDVTTESLATGDSLPDPDAWVCAEEAVETEWLSPRISAWSPSDVLLVVEVSDETVAEDLSVKARLYGGAGYAVYWVLTRDTLYVHTQPVGDGYRSVVRHRRGDEVALPCSGTTVAVADLLGE